MADSGNFRHLLAGGPPPPKKKFGDSTNPVSMPTLPQNDWFLPGLPLPPLPPPSFRKKTKGGIPTPPDSAANRKKPLKVSSTSLSSNVLPSPPYFSASFSPSSSSSLFALKNALGNSKSASRNHSLEFHHPNPLLSQKIKKEIVKEVSNTAVYTSVSSSISPSIPSSSSTSSSSLPMPPIPSALSFQQRRQRGNSISPKSMHKKLPHSKLKIVENDQSLSPASSSPVSAQSPSSSSSFPEYSEEEKLSVLPDFLRKDLGELFGSGFKEKKDRITATSPLSTSPKSTSLQSPTSILSALSSSSFSFSSSRKKKKKKTKSLPSSDPRYFCKLVSSSSLSHLFLSSSPVSLLLSSPPSVSPLLSPQPSVSSSLSIPPCSPPSKLSLVSPSSLSSLSSSSSVSSVSSLSSSLSPLSSSSSFSFFDNIPPSLRVHLSLPLLSLHEEGNASKDDDDDLCVDKRTLPEDGIGKDFSKDWRKQASGQIHSYSFFPSSFRKERTAFHFPLFFKYSTNFFLSTIAHFAATLRPRFASSLMRQVLELDLIKDNDRPLYLPSPTSFPLLCHFCGSIMVPHITSDISIVKNIHPKLQKKAKKMYRKFNNRKNSAYQRLHPHAVFPQASLKNLQTVSCLLCGRMRVIGGVEMDRYLCGGRYLDSWKKMDRLDGKMDRLMVRKMDDLVGNNRHCLLSSGKSLLKDISLNAKRRNKRKREEGTSDDGDGMNLDMVMNQYKDKEKGEDKDKDKDEDENRDKDKKRDASIYQSTLPSSKKTPRGFFDEKKKLKKKKERKQSFLKKLMVKEYLKVKIKEDKKSRKTKNKEKNIEIKRENNEEKRGDILMNQKKEKEIVGWRKEVKMEEKDWEKEEAIQKAKLVSMQINLPNLSKLSKLKTKSENDNDEKNLTVPETRKVSLPEKRDISDGKMDKSSSLVPKPPSLPSFSSFSSKRASNDSSNPKGKRRVTRYYDEDTAKKTKDVSSSLSSLSSSSPSSSPSSSFASKASLKKVEMIKSGQKKDEPTKKTSLYDLLNDI